MKARVYFIDDYSEKLCTGELHLHRNCVDNWNGMRWAEGPNAVGLCDGSCRIEVELPGEETKLIQDFQSKNTPTKSSDAD